MGVIDTIIATLDNTLSNIKPPLTPLPSLVLLAAQNRSGLSTSDVVANIITRMGDAGVIRGDENENEIADAMEYIRVEEILNALIKSGKVEVVIPPGVKIIGSGANSGGPVIVNGTTIEPAVGYGIIR